MANKIITQTAETSSAENDLKLYICQTENGAKVFRQIDPSKILKSENVSYDSSDSDLSAGNVKEAIDALASGMVSLAPKFGVSGVGGSATTLTRLWDSVGKTAKPGTDTVAAISDFDRESPFNRNKCVGNWSMAEDGSKAVFTVNAYYGDADYAEDGTMGNYVAIDVEPFFWFHDYYNPTNQVLGVSKAKQGTGWDYHPVCLDYAGNPREHTYLPCYDLAVDENGLPVSLPGYHPQFGAYYALRSTARKYLGSIVSDYAILEPTAAWHYQYLLMTIEFATQNMQTVMTGATSMRYSADVITAAPADNQIVVTSAIGGNYVVGQSIYIGSSYSATPSDVSAYNIITAIESCDEDGTINSSGSYRLITYSGTTRAVTAGTTQLGSKPWITGSCCGYNSLGAVLGHTGSPVSNTTSKYPCMYRWLENPYGNINHTCVDLMNAKTTDADGKDILQWYFLADPSSYMPSGASYPNAADLTAYWELMDTVTPNSGYKDGYITKMGYDEDKPYVPIPVATGGSATTYYSDYASLVNSSAVRAVRRGGGVGSGSVAGPCSLTAGYAPSSGGWNCGGGLHFIQ